MRDSFDPPLKISFIEIIVQIVRPSDEIYEVIIPNSEKQGHFFLFCSTENWTRKKTPGRRQETRQKKQRQETGLLIHPEPRLISRAGPGSVERLIGPIDSFDPPLKISFIEIIVQIIRPSHEIYEVIIPNSMQIACVAKHYLLPQNTEVNGKLAFAGEKSKCL